MIKHDTTFRIGQLVSERGTTYRGHIESAGHYPGEWVVRLVGGEQLTCLTENLVAHREPDLASDGTAI